MMSRQHDLDRRFGVKRRYYIYEIDRSLGCRCRECVLRMTNQSGIRNGNGGHTSSTCQSRSRKTLLIYSLTIVLLLALAPTIGKKARTHLFSVPAIRGINIRPRCPEVTSAHGSGCICATRGKRASSMLRHGLADVIAARSSRRSGSMLELVHECWTEVVTV